MGFEVFEKRMAPLGKAPSVTIQKRGLFSLNRAAHALMGAPKTVELLYDRSERIVGLRPIDEDAPHAYILRPQSSVKDTGPLLLAGTAFTTFYGIDTTVSRRWTPTMEDGILCIDLKKHGVEIIGNRGARRTDGSQDDD
ncbi:hypothetical protein [Streptosporangium sp. NPDC006007]|uniref:hypothetical protein n=1 Tax=Streptosporangium sp. NPDC006007 TaxID=3154575 RepID=UPI0033AC32D3